VKKLIKEITYKDTWLIRDEKVPDYKAYLESDEWKQLKQELKQLKKYQKCRACGKKRYIQLHHKTYRWIHTKREQLGIVAFCGKCHKRTHAYAKRKNVSVIRATRYIITHTKKVKSKR